MWNKKSECASRAKSKQNTCVLGFAPVHCSRSLAAQAQRPSDTCDDVVTVPFRGDRARLAVVVYSDLWRQSDNFTLAPLTGSYKRFKMVHTYIQVPDRAGIGTLDLVAENDRMQWVPRG